MAARRAVIHALETALEERRYDAARQLIHEASELGEHDHDPSHFVSEVHGYRLILECLTARQNSGGSLPSDLLEASRLYVDAHRLAPRRQVRRVCLEGRSFGRRA